MLLRTCSSVHHLEEIREAGLETPSVNQIEVCLPFVSYPFCALRCAEWVQLQPFCQQRPITEYCEKNNIVVQAYCPLVRGRFDNPALQEVAAKVRVSASYAPDKVPT